MKKLLWFSLLSVLFLTHISVGFAQENTRKMRISAIFVKSENEAQLIFEKLNLSADFAELARQYSIGPKKEQGGDIGYFTPEEMQPELKAVALNLRIGQHSDIVKTDSGYFILLKTEEKYPKPELIVQKGHTADLFVNCLVFSPDGKLLASGGLDHSGVMHGIVILWDLLTGKELRSLRVDDDVRSIAFSPDGNVIACGTRKSIKFYETKTGKELLTINTKFKDITSIAFNANGKILAVGGKKTPEIDADKIVKIWLDIMGNFTDLGNDGLVKLFDVATGSELYTPLDGSATVRSVIFSPQGNVLASGIGAGDIRIWDFTNNKFVTFFTLIEDSSLEHSVIEVDPNNNNMIMPVPNIVSLAFSPDGKLLASGNSGLKDGIPGRILIWDVFSGKQIRVIKGRGQLGPVIGFSSDGRNLISAWGGRTIQIWNVYTGEKLGEYLGHSSYIESMTISPNGKTLATCGGLNKTIIISEFETGKNLRILAGNAARIESVALSRNGQFLACASDTSRISDYYSVKLWNLYTGRIIREFKSYSEVNSIVFSPDGHALACVYDDNSIKLWDTKSGTGFCQLTGHTDLVTSVCFDYENSIIVSGSKDKTIRIWDLHTGKEISLLSGCAKLIW